MHIPDGYLSPGTCAGLYAAAAPFWYVALRRLKKALHTRMVPLLSVFSAFSFIIMMFNLPLPGGTTGHATGVAVAAIVLGPSASILAITTALVIQAVFFGDGGITAIGANCFNMAIIGSITSWLIYKLAAGNSALTSHRRVVAAAVAGYFSINAAALAAAVEFGIQPLLFHDSAGTPLYAPYPLRIAIPAMMIGHLTVAGLAELVVSAGVVAYLQRADPALLANSASGAESAGYQAGGWRSAKPLWVALAALMVLTPLGIVAAGSAWGEWMPDDFSRPAERAQIAAASAQTAPPVEAPAGLRRLASVWTAPMPRYAPPFLRSAGFGYILSAVMGSGILILVFLGAGFATRTFRRLHE
jgi:cobalt/nickel transport system permease protein